MEPAIKMVLAAMTLPERVFFWHLMIEEVVRGRQGNRLLRGFVMGTSRKHLPISVCFSSYDLRVLFSEIHCFYGQKGPLDHPACDPV